MSLDQEICRHGIEGTRVHPGKVEHRRTHLEVLPRTQETGISNFKTTYYLLGLEQRGRDKASRSTSPTETSPAERD